MGNEEMGKRMMFKLTWTLILIGMLVLSFRFKTGRASGTIFIRADGSVDPATAPIQRDGDIYAFSDNIYDEIVVQRDNIIVDGATYQVQGTGSGIGINLTSRYNVTIKNMEIKEFDNGIKLAYSLNNSISGNKLEANSFSGISLFESSSNSISGNSITGHSSGINLVKSSNNTISGNDITENGWGIQLFVSDNNTIFGNNIAANEQNGIEVSSSSNNNVYGNNIANNQQLGIMLSGSSNYNSIKENNIANNGFGGIRHHSSLENTVSGNNITDHTYYHGINLEYSSNNIISGNNIKNNKWGISFNYNSLKNTISGNNITNNDHGIWLCNSSNNNFCHNNFINTVQVVSSIPYLVNGWNDSVEGNYWSNYAGVDINQDGIGDFPHVIYSNNQDNHPLMGMFQSFNVPLVGLRVIVISNSSIRDFEHFKSDSTIKMQVSNMTANQTFGFCRVCIPHALMSEPYNVTIDGANPVFWNYTLYDDRTRRWIYFVYQHSTHEVIIQGSDTTPPIISILSPENKTYAVEDVPLTFALNESTSWMGYSLDGQANVTVTGNRTLSGLSDGSHSLIVYAKDTDGNTGASETVRFTINTQQTQPFLSTSEMILIAIVIVVIICGATGFFLYRKRKSSAEPRPISK